MADSIAAVLAQLVGRGSGVTLAHVEPMSDTNSLGERRPGGAMPPPPSGSGAPGLPGLPPAPPGPQAPARPPAGAPPSKKVPPGKPPEKGPPPKKPPPKKPFRTERD